MPISKEEFFLHPHTITKKNPGETSPPFFGLFFFHLLFHLNPPFVFACFFLQFIFESDLFSLWYFFLWPWKKKFAGGRVGWRCVFQSAKKKHRKHKPKHKKNIEKPFVFQCLNMNFMKRSMKGKKICKLKKV